MTTFIKKYASRYGLGVSSRLSTRIAVRTNSMRVFMIYSAFFTLGGSFILYLLAAFGLKVRDFVLARKVSVFDLD